MAEIKVPTLGESVSEATVAKWFKNVGDAVAMDEPLVELETDKVTVEVRAESAGTLAEIVAGPGSEVAVGAVLGVLGAAGAAPAKKAEPAKAAAAAAPAKAAPAPAKVPAPAAAAPAAKPPGPPKAAPAFCMAFRDASNTQSTSGSSPLKSRSTPMRAPLSALALRNFV